VHIGGDGIGIGNNLFTVSAAGALVATSATITGTITCQGGSTWTGNAINGDSYVTCTNLASINADLGTVTAGSITGGDIRTASSGARAAMSSTGGFGTAHHFECYDATRLRSYMGAGVVALASTDGDTGVYLTSTTYGIVSVYDTAGNVSVEMNGNEDALVLRETTTPGADAGYGKLYTKSDNKLYFQSGDGAEHEVAYVP